MSFKAVFNVYLYVESHDGGSEEPGKTQLLLWRNAARQRIASWKTGVPFKHEKVERSLRGKGENIGVFVHKGTQVQETKRR